MKKLFIFFFLLHCILLAITVSVAHEDQKNPQHSHPDMIYQTPVYIDPPEYEVETNTWEKFKKINGPRGWYHPGPPFKPVVVPYTPYSTNIGKVDDTVMKGEEGQQCNLMDEKSCKNGLECQEENVDGTELCPGRPNLVKLSETHPDQVQCGTGPGATTPCGSGVQSNVCIANIKWPSSDKNFSASFPWDQVGGGASHWEVADGPHKRCFFQHSCVTATDLSPKTKCQQVCKKNCYNDCKHSCFVTGHNKSGNSYQHDKLFAEWLAAKKAYDEWYWSEANHDYYEDWTQAGKTYKDWEHLNKLHEDLIAINKSYDDVCHEQCKDPNLCESKCTTECTVPSQLNETSLLSDQCTYESACFNSHMFPRPSRNSQGAKIVDLQPCTNHHQCSSGMCTQFNMPSKEKAKVCAPFAKCRRPCKKFAEALGPGDHCCLGLWQMGGFCSDGSIIPSLPEDIEFEVDQGSCEPSLYELRCTGVNCKKGETAERVKVGTSIGSGSGSGLSIGQNLARYELKITEGGRQRSRVPLAVGSDDKTIVARSVWQFERYMYAAEWLWGQAASAVFSSSVGYGKLHERARDLGKKMAELRVLTDNKFTKELAVLDEKGAAILKTQLASGKGKGSSEGESLTIHSTGNSAGGPEYMRFMADHHMAMSRIDAARFSDTMSSIVLGSGLQMAHSNPAILGDNYPYGKYGVYDGPWHGWFFPWPSSSRCGTVFEQNRVCVIEQQLANGLGGGGGYMLDPVYPDSVSGKVSVPGQEQVFSTPAVVTAAVLCPVAGLVMALINWLKGWEIPVKGNQFNNNKLKLRNLILQGFTPYADKVLKGSTPEENKYNEEHKVRNIPVIYQRDELKLLLLDMNISEKEFWDQLECIEVTQSKTKAFDDHCKALYPDWPLTTKKLHQLALVKIADAGVLHTAKYAAGGSQYPTHGAGYMKNFFNVMLDYLALYYQKSSLMHMKVNECLIKMATDTQHKLKDGAGVSMGATNISGPSAKSEAMDGETFQGMTPCTGSPCSANGKDSNTLGSTDFGINGFNSGGIDGGSYENSKNWKGGGSYGSGKMSGSDQDRLLATRQKRLDERNRALLGREKDPHDAESGSDRLRQDLEGINGAKAIFQTLKKGISADLVEMPSISAPSVPGTEADSGSSSNNMDGRVSNRQGSGSGDQKVGPQQSFGLSKLFGDSNSNNDVKAADGTATGLSQNEEELLLKESQKGKGEQFDPDVDTLFKQISRAYMHYAVPRLLKKK